MSKNQIAISVQNVTLAFDGYTVQKNVSFSVKWGEVFVIMGGSGCGKSTLLRSMVGLLRPTEGEVFYGGQPFWKADEEHRSEVQRRLGVLFQSSALWSSMTVGENIALPLSQYTTLAPFEIAAIVSLKLALVGLKGFEAFLPSELSGGMKKRAALARAIALDPVSSKRLDDLILELRDGLGATVVMVTHELPSIFAIADNAVFLDAETHTATAHGNPIELRDSAADPAVRAFLTRGSVQATRPDMSGSRGE